MTRQFLLNLQDVYPFLLIFIRFVAAFTALPGFGDQFVNPRFRALFAFLIALVLAPVILPLSPKAPPNAWIFIFHILSEAFIGFFIGTCARLIFVALDVAGMVMGYKAGLLNAFTFNPVTGGQSPLPATFLGLAATILVFATNLHHLMIQTIVDSYQVYQPDVIQKIFPFSREMAVTLAHLILIAFTLALQFSAPFIVIGLLFFISIGILNRLMPQLPVFFISQPIQITLGFIILFLVFTGIMDNFLTTFEDLFSNLWQPKDMDLNF